MLLLLSFVGREWCPFVQVGKALPLRCSLYVNFTHLRGLSLNAIGYIRVSSEEQSDSQLSLDAQRAQIEAYCQFKQLNLIEILSDEAISGGKPIQDRPSGSLLFSKLQENSVGSVVATKLDRMFRNALDCLTVNQLFTDAGISLHLLDLNVDTSNAMGKAFLTIAAAFAELELNRGKERTRDALKALSDRGVALGAVPYGMTEDRSQDMRVFVTDSVEQQTLELMFTLRQNGLTYEQVATELNRCGVLTKSGKTQWRRGTVHRILRRHDGKETLKADEIS